ncbi:hypothetical protein [Deinococcus depolymerans]|uniref:Uncharacterized protein n=1 Tax=Deinococcus depolymerans TaxID=392408 RepID=A0ABN1BWE2_9DEIO
MTGPKKGSRGRAPQRNTAQGRGGITRDTIKPARPARDTGGTDRKDGPRRDTRSETRSDRPPGPRGSDARPGRAGAAGGRGGVSGSRSGENPARRKPGEGSRSDEGRSEGRGAVERRFTSGGPARRSPPKPGKKALPELKRVQLDAPAPDAAFRDRDGETLTFPDSNLKRVAAKILTEKKKAWRYRPFAFPLFTDRGSEQSFHFDFYIYDAEDSVIRLILVIPFESREVWDRVGRFKRQYPMYTYELWTPEKLARLSGPRGRLEF